LEVHTFLVIRSKTSKRICKIWNLLWRSYWYCCWILWFCFKIHRILYLNCWVSQDQGSARLMELKSLHEERIRILQQLCDLQVFFSLNTMYTSILTSIFFLQCMYVYFLFAFIMFDVNDWIRTLWRIWSVLLLPMLSNWLEIR